MQDPTESALNKIPAKDLLELYLDTMQQFLEMKKTPYTAEAKEKLKEELKTKLKQLCENLGVNFEEEIKKITKE